MRENLCFWNGSKSKSECLCLLVVLHAQQLHIELASLLAQMELLFCMMPSLGGVTGFMTCLHGNRHFFGTIHIHNQMQYETVKK